MMFFFFIFILLSPPLFCNIFFCWLRLSSSLECANSHFTIQFSLFMALPFWMTIEFFCYLFWMCLCDDCVYMWFLLSSKRFFLTQSRVNVSTLILSDKHITKGIKMDNFFCIHVSNHRVFLLVVKMWKKSQSQTHAHKFHIRFMDWFSNCY